MKEQILNGSVNITGITTVKNILDVTGSVTMRDNLSVSGDISGSKINTTGLVCNTDSTNANAFSVYNSQQGINTFTLNKLGDISGSGHLYTEKNLCRN